MRGSLGRRLPPTVLDRHSEGRVAGEAPVSHPGRPKIGEGAKVVSLSIEGDLLRKADALAKKRKLTRSELVLEALRAALAKAG